MAGGVCGGGGVYGGGMCMAGGPCMCGGGHAWRRDVCGGTHPTGMHSCHS